MEPNEQETEICEAMQDDDPEAWIRRIAKLCHETNRTYCMSLGDRSQVPWDLAPENIKESAIAGVKNLINNPDTTPEQSHASWLNFKVADGWRWGKVKDSEKKTHPCLAPYSELPAEERMKDQIFLLTARTEIRNHKNSDKG